MEGLGAIESKKFYLAGSQRPHLDSRPQASPGANYGHDLPSMRSGRRDSRPSTLQLQLHQGSLVRPAACDRLPEPSAFCRSKPLQWWLLLRQDLSHDQKKRLDTAVMLVSWLVWKERNARVFNNLERTPGQLLDDILAEGGSWIRAGATKLAAIGWSHRSLTGTNVNGS